MLKFTMMLWIERRKEIEIIGLDSYDGDNHRQQLITIICQNEASRNRRIRIVCII
jgi:hypothetical protein